MHTTTHLLRLHIHQKQIISSHCPLKNISITCHHLHMEFVEFIGDMIRNGKYRLVDQHHQCDGDEEKDEEERGKKENHEDQDIVMRLGPRSSSHSRTSENALALAPVPATALISVKKKPKTAIEQSELKTSDQMPLHVKIQTGLNLSIHLLCN
jgi:hypothetical protein